MVSVAADVMMRGPKNWSLLCHIFPLYFSHQAAAASIGHLAMAGRCCEMTMTRLQSRDLSTFIFIFLQN